MSKPKKDKSVEEPMVVLTTRITPEERDRVRAASGWAGSRGSSTTR